MAVFLDEVLALHMRSVKPQPADPPAAKRIIYQTYKKLIDQAVTIKKCHYNDQLSGLILITKPMLTRFGPPESTATMLFDSSDPGAKTWGKETISRLSSLLQGPYTIRLRPQNRFLMPVLENLGFGSKKVEIIGDVEDAMSQIDRMNIMQPDAHGFQINDLSVEQVDQVNLMMRDFFLANPQLGFGSSRTTAKEQAEIDARESTKLRQALQDGHQSHFTLEKGGQIVGYFGFNPIFNHPIFGNWTGVNIILLPSAQRLGVGWAAAKHMIKRMPTLGIKTLFGVSSNPAVFYAGAKLGMKPRRIILAKEGPFLEKNIIRQLDTLYTDQ